MYNLNQTFMEKKKGTKKTNGSQLIVVPKRQVEVTHHDQTPNDLLALAIQNNLDIDKLERLMIMQEKYQAKQAEKLYFEAFGKFQSIAPELVKNKSVSFPHREGDGKTEYKYQELGDIPKHIRQPLADCGLSYRWDQHDDKDDITVTCIISHTSGHQEKSQPLSGKADTSGKKNII